MKRSCLHKWINVKRRGRQSEFVAARICKLCGALEDTPPRQQQPGDGREQKPRRNEEQRPY